MPEVQILVQGVNGDWYSPSNLARLIATHAQIIHTGTVLAPSYSHILCIIVPLLTSKSDWSLSIIGTEQSCRKPFKLACYIWATVNLWGHPETRRVYDSKRLKYYWLYMFNDVYTAVDDCQLRAKKKPWSNTNTIQRSSCRPAYLVYFYSTLFPSFSGVNNENRVFVSTTNRY